MTPIFDSFLVYALHPKQDGLAKRLVGKYVLHDGKIHVLEDHDGVLNGLDGRQMSSAGRQIDALHRSSYYQVVQKDLRAPEQVQAQDASDEQSWENETFGNGGQVQPAAPAAQPSTNGLFRYQRAGHDTPRVVEIRDGRILLDGKDLPAEEAQTLIANVKAGTAKLSRVEGRDFGKAAREHYEGFLVLQKGDLNQSFDALRALVSAGHLHPDHYDSLRRELYQDEMIPGLGNKKSFRDFIKTGGREGVHVMLDGNGMKSINDTHGHEAGDNAITAMGQGLRNAIDKTVGPDIAKAHRFGGDEFHLHVPTLAHAHQVMRAFRAEMDAIPPIKGTHKLSMSAGIGQNPKEADAALYHAKAAHKINPAPPSLTAHSLHPEGPGPMPGDVPTAPPPPEAALVRSEAVDTLQSMKKAEGDPDYAQRMAGSQDHIQAGQPVSLRLRRPMNPQKDLGRGDEDTRVMHIEENHPGTIVQLHHHPETGAVWGVDARSESTGRIHRFAKMVNKPEVRGGAPVPSWEEQTRDNPNADTFALGRDHFEPIDQKFAYAEHRNTSKWPGRRAGLFRTVGHLDHKPPSFD